MTEDKRDLISWWRKHGPRRRKRPRCIGAEIAQLWTEREKHNGLMNAGRRAVRALDKRIAELGGRNGHS